MIYGYKAFFLNTGKLPQQNIAVFPGPAFIVLQTYIGKPRLHICQRKKTGRNIFLFGNGSLYYRHAASRLQLADSGRNDSRSC